MKIELELSFDGLVWLRATVDRMGGSHRYDREILDQLTHELRKGDRDKVEHDKDIEAEQIFWEIAHIKTEKNEEYYYILRKDFKGLLAKIKKVFRGDRG